MSILIYDNYMPIRMFLKVDTLFACYQSISLGFSGGSVIKNVPAMQEMQVQPLRGEDPLEKETATHSDILAWEIPWTEKTGGLHSMGLQKSWTQPSN